MFWSIIWPFWSIFNKKKPTFSVLSGKKFWKSLADFLLMSGGLLVKVVFDGFPNTWICFQVSIIAYWDLLFFTFPFSSSNATGTRARFAFT